MELIQKTLNYKNEPPRELYFRELNGGEELKLLEGQKAVSNQTGGVDIEVNFAGEHSRGFQLLQMTLVTADGVQVYKNYQELLREKGSKLKAMKNLAIEAKNEFAIIEADAGKE